MNGLRWAAIPVLAGLAACGYVDRYEEGVYDFEPAYCYQSLGEIVCHREPYHRDSKRLVNYFGPHPSRYDPPEAPEVDAPQPPTTALDYYVITPEPVPEDGVVLRFGAPETQ